MPKRITCAEHSNISELEQLYKQALIRSRKSSVEEITGYSRTWIYTLVKRYNELGISGIGDRLRQNQGAKALVDDIQQAQLWQALQETARLWGVMEWALMLRTGCRKYEE